MKFLLSLVLLLLLAACAAPDSRPVGPEDLAPDFGRPGEAGYHLLMAEIALQRDLPELAATEYLRAARASEDPSVAERATLIASAFGTPEERMAAAQRWASLAPEELQPRRFLVRLHLERRSVEAAADQLAWLRDAAGAAEHAFLPLLPLVTEARDRAAALAALSAVAEAYPEDASGAYAQAYLALRAGELAQAQAQAARALALEPEWTDAAILYARVIAASGRDEEALAWLAARPEAGEQGMQLERAILLIAADRTAEARALLNELLAVHPDDADTLRALGYLEYFDGRPAEARRIFTKLLASGRHADDALFHLGGIAEQEGEIEEAARFYSRVAGGEHLATAQVRLALVMFRMGRPELAINHLEIFARRNPEAAIELGAARAELLMRLGLPGEALDAYDEIVARHPDEIGIRYARGLLHVELARVDDALADFEHILGLQPEDPTALNALGYTLTDMTDRHKEAYPLIRRALELEPENPAILDSMGWVLFKLGRAREALPYLERSWELQRDPEIAAHLGEILWSLGRIDDARQAWLDGIVEFPGSRVLLDTMDRLDP
jgi:tetratricopeptide (TPR) repeat protein